MSLTVGKSARGISFAAANIIGSSNEDRFTAILKHSETKLSDLSSFGVFDGHSGNYGSEKCKEILHAEVARRFQSKLRDRILFQHLQTQDQQQQLQQQLQNQHVRGAIQLEEPRQKGNLNVVDGRYCKSPRSIYIPDGVNRSDHPISQQHYHSNNDNNNSNSSILTTSTSDEHHVVYDSLLASEDEPYAPSFSLSGADGEEAEQKQRQEQEQTQKQGLRAGQGRIGMSIDRNDEQMEGMDKNIAPSSVATASPAAVLSAGTAKDRLSRSSFRRSGGGGSEKEGYYQNGDSVASAAVAAGSTAPVVALLNPSYLTSSSVDSLTNLAYILHTSPAHAVRRGRPAPTPIKATDTATVATKGTPAGAATVNAAIAGKGTAGTPVHVAADAPKDDVIVDAEHDGSSFPVVAEVNNTDSKGLPLVLTPQREQQEPMGQELPLPLAPPLTAQEEVDALFCEALHEAVAEVNDIVTRRSQCGTTMTSLFIHRVYVADSSTTTNNNSKNNTKITGASSHGDVSVGDAGGGPGEPLHYYRVYCGNIGDSRCVMIGGEQLPVAEARRKTLEIRQKKKNKAARESARRKGLKNDGGGSGAFSASVIGGGPTSPGSRGGSVSPDMIPPPSPWAMGVGSSPSVSKARPMNSAAKLTSEARMNGESGGRNGGGKDREPLRNSEEGGGEGEKKVGSAHSVVSTTVHTTSTDQDSSLLQRQQQPQQRQQPPSAARSSNPNTNSLPTGSPRRSSALSGKSGSRKQPSQEELDEMERLLSDSKHLNLPKSSRYDGNFDPTRLSESSDSLDNTIHDALNIGKNNNSNTDESGRFIDEFAVVRSRAKLFSSAADGDSVPSFGSAGSFTRDAAIADDVSARGSARDSAKHGVRFGGDAAGERKSGKDPPLAVEHPSTGINTKRSAKQQTKRGLIKQLFSSKGKEKKKMATASTSASQTSALDSPHHGDSSEEEIGGKGEQEEEENEEGGEQNDWKEESEEPMTGVDGEGGMNGLESASSGGDDSESSCTVDRSPIPRPRVDDSLDNTVHIEDTGHNGTAVSASAPTQQNTSTKRNLFPVSLGRDGKGKGQQKLGIAAFDSLDNTVHEETQPPSIFDTVLPEKQGRGGDSPLSPPRRRDPAAAEARAKNRISGEDLRAALAKAEEELRRKESDTFSGAPAAGAAGPISYSSVSCSSTISYRAAVLSIEELTKVGEIVTIVPGNRKVPVVGTRELEDSSAAVSASGAQTNAQQQAMNVAVRMSLLSEDHNLTCKRERRRVRAKAALRPVSLPLPIYAPWTGVLSIEEELGLERTGYGTGPDKRPMEEAEDSEDEVDNINNSSSLIRGKDTIKALRNVMDQVTMFERDIPDSDILLRKRCLADQFLACLAEFRRGLVHQQEKKSESGEKECEREGKGKGASGDDPEDLPWTMNIVHESSFMDFRRGKTGKKGPMAYFGRYGLSFLMSRSIGDRYGPRGCIAQSDVTAVTIRPNQHARFLIASDGVWDVLSSEAIRKSGLYHRFAKPQDLAVYIAYKARKRREEMGMRMDDITVLVVDVNPEHAVFVNTRKTLPDTFYRIASSSSSSSSSNKQQQQQQQQQQLDNCKHAVVAVGAPNAAADSICLSNVTYLDARVTDSLKITSSPPPTSPPAFVTFSLGNWNQGTVHAQMIEHTRGRSHSHIEPLPLALSALPSPSDPLSRTRATSSPPSQGERNAQRVPPPHHSEPTIFADHGSNVSHGNDQQDEDDNIAASVGNDARGDDGGGSVVGPVAGPVAGSMGTHVLHAHASAFYSHHEITLYQLRRTDPSCVIS